LIEESWDVNTAPQPAAMERVAGGVFQQQSDGGSILQRTRPESKLLPEEACPFAPAEEFTVRSSEGCRFDGGDHGTDPGCADPLYREPVAGMAGRTGCGVAQARLFEEVPAVYLHRDPVDFRKAINGLVVIIEQALDMSPFSGALFVFCNRRCDKLKVVYWDETGFCLWYKRLEKAKFKWPRQYQTSIMTLSESQWNWLLSGYDVIGHEVLEFEHCAG